MTMDELIKAGRVTVIERGGFTWYLMNFSTPAKSMYARIFEEKGFSDETVKECIDWAIRCVNLRINGFAEAIQSDNFNKNYPGPPPSDVYMSDWYRVAKTGCCGKP